MKIINDIDELLSYQDYDTVITSYLNNEYNNISHEKFLEIIVKIITAGKKVLFLSDLNIEDEIILSREFINHGGEFYVKKYKPLTNRYNTPNISNNDISINTNNRILFLSTSFYNITSKIEIDLYNKTKDKYDFITKNNYIRLIGLFNEEEYITALERTNNPNVVMTLNRPIFSISKDVIKQLSIIDNIKCCINFRPTKLILIITYPDPIEFIKDYINFVKLFFNIDVEKMVLSEVSLDVTLYSTDEHTYLPVDRNKIKRYLKELQKNIDIPILTYNEINIL
ncbi:MAG: hypothetical protein LBU51_03950 [Bacteroidales bacterium]|nr:hypothetical protein [Bacteroidales bacterium]